MKARDCTDDELRAFFNLLARQGQATVELTGKENTYEVATLCNPRAQRHATVFRLNLTAHFDDRHADLVRKVLEQLGGAK